MNRFSTPLYIVLNDFPNWSLFKVFFNETNAIKKVQKIIQTSNNEWIQESTYTWRRSNDNHMWIETVSMDENLDKIYVVLCDEYERTLVGVYTDREQALNKVEEWLTKEGITYVYVPDHSWDYNDYTIRIWEPIISDRPTLTKAGRRS